MVTPDLSDLSVLVVDSEIGMRRVIVNIFRDLGIRKIFEAGSAKDALKICAHDKPDIMFTESVLSPVSGEQLTHKIREGIKGVDPSLPIVMVSALSDIERIIAARDSGVTEFLAKPVSAKQVVTRLMAVISNPRVFVRSSHFIGPDRRRHRRYFGGEDRRTEE